MVNQFAEASALDEVQAKAFLETVSTVLDHGAVAAMMSIGHRLGLFDTLAALPPSGSATIADAAGLSERYVREWLATMVTSSHCNFLLI